MIAFPFTADELPAQLDGIRQIQVVTLDAVITLCDTLEAGIEATPHVDNDRLLLLDLLLLCSQARPFDFN